MKLKQIAFFLSSIAFIISVNWACSKSHVDNSANQSLENRQQAEHCISDTLSRLMRSEAVRTETIEDILKLAGQVSFDQDKVVRVMPLTSGQVLDVKVTLGDYVQAGQTLATLKSAEIVSGYNDLATNQADLDAAQRTLNNVEARYKNGLASEQDYQLAKSELAKAQSNLEKAKETLGIYGQQNTSKNGIISIKSPISGYIVEKKISTGTQVRQDNSDNLFTISGLQDVWVLANVYENDISRVREGYEAQVTTLAYPDKVFNGKIEKISQVIDPNDKSLKVRIRLNNAGNLLKPDMFTAVSVVNKTGTKALALPTASIITDYGHSYVIILKDNCHYFIREVHPIKNAGGKTYVNDGVKEGDVVVTKEQLLLYNSLKEL
jgi:cobalt-zinc-cadmium efflux system membrane fusion protein